MTPLRGLNPFAETERDVLFGRDAERLLRFTIDLGDSASITRIGRCVAPADPRNRAGVERCWRDAMMLTAIDGTATMQRLIIGRETLGTPAFV